VLSAISDDVVAQSADDDGAVQFSRMSLDLTKPIDLTRL